jgi:hypothetical protein
VAGTAAGFEEATLLQALQHRIEEDLCRLSRHEPFAQCGEHRIMQAGVREVEAQGVLPVHATAYRGSRRTIRQISSTLQDRDER